MNKTLLSSAFVGLAFSGLAVPRIEQGELQYGNDRIVRLSYVLKGEPAIVTLDFQTNATPNAATATWVTIGGENFPSVEGNLNRIVDTLDVAQEIVWRPWTDWPGHKILAGGFRAVVTAWPTNDPPDYCVINIRRQDTVTPNTIKDRVRFYLDERSLPGGLKENATYWTTNMVMRRVHAAGKTFRMGSPWTECQGQSNYGQRTPSEEATTVTFSEDYWMAIFPMTCKQASMAFGNSGNHSNGDKGPMTGRRWSEFRIDATLGDNASTMTDYPQYDWPANGCSHAVGANSWFATMKTTTGIEFDFPTEAQWEFACRAGTSTPYYDGSKDPYDINHMEKYSAIFEPLGWYSGNCSAVQPVMGKEPNAWGFYDMLGNALEFCLDHQPVADGSYNPRPVGITATDYPGPQTGTIRNGVHYFRITKGGKYSSGVGECRCASRARSGECGQGNPGENACRPVAALNFAFAAKPADPVATACDGIAVTAFRQRSDSRNVIVDYSLSAPAIVTCEIFVRENGNFVLVDGARLGGFSGDVNRFIGEAGAHRLFWTPADDHAGASFNAADVKVELKAWTKDDPPPYCAVNLSTSNSVFYYSSAAAVPGGVKSDLYKTDFLLMRRIPAKGVTWKMGSPSTEAFRNEDRETRHEVTLSADYWMGVYEVTQDQYSHASQGYGTGFTSYSDSRTLPANGIAYNSIRGDLGAANWPTTGRGQVGGILSTLRKRTGVGFDLPTEAQWEYACRAGSGAAWNCGPISTASEDAASKDLAALAVMSYSNQIFDPDVATPAPVGSFEPNAWGLYDMHGNVIEWCLDYGSESTVVSADPVTDPEGPTSGSKRIGRGGGYTSGAKECRSAYRTISGETGGANTYFGFRLMAPLEFVW